MPKDVVQDDITFPLVAEITIVNDTVKLIADVSATITKDNITEANLQDRVRAMMKKLIPSATWNFAGMTRETNSSGLETVDLQASARVSEKENYALERRGRAVAEDALRIVDIRTDTTPPLSMIEKNESTLRVDLLHKVNDELTVINKAMNVNYRVGSVVFQPAQSDLSNTRNSKTAMASSYGSGFSAMSADVPGSGEALGNAVKLTMRATVVYRRIVN